MKAELLVCEFDGHPVGFTGDGWFNATAAAARFGKRPAEWLRLPDTQRYLNALCRRHEVGKSHFAKTSRGGGAERRRNTQGTWLHPRLGVAFARWLDPDFACWCDEQIDRLVRVQPEVIQALEAENAGLTERVKLLDRIAAAEGVCCLTDAARTLGVRFPLLRQWLLANDWIFRRNTQWMGKAGAVKAGWLRNSAFVYDHDDDGRDKVRWQVLVTGAGMIRLGEAFDEIVNPPPKHEVPAPAATRTAGELKAAAAAAHDAIKAVSELLAKLDAPTPADVIPGGNFIEFEDS